MLSQPAMQKVWNLWLQMQRCTMQMPQVHGTSAVAAFRTGVISIDNAEPNMDLVYALGFITGFFIFSLYPIFR